MKVALIQLKSSLNPQENLEKIQSLIDQAKIKGEVDAIFLPEVFYSMSDGTKPTPYLVENGNEHFENILTLAKKNSVYLLGGSAATLENGKVFNRVYNIDPSGNLINTYDKIHLFRINLQGKEKSTVINEGDVYSSGSALTTYKLREFHFGFTVCFDLRFPELYRELFKKGVNVITVASAFTVPTGKAHWLTLLKARAIENQSYIIASDQWGKNNEKIETYGHSVIIDPWGKVLVIMEEGEGIQVCDLDIQVIQKIRSRMDISPRL